MKTEYTMNRMAPFSVLYFDGEQIHMEDFDDAEDFVKDVSEGDTTFASSIKEFRSKHKFMYIIQDEGDIEEALKHSGQSYLVKEKLKQRR